MGRDSFEMGALYSVVDRLVDSNIRRVELIVLYRAQGMR